MYSDKRGWTYQLPLGTRVGFIVSENITPGDIAPEVTPPSQIGSGVGYGLMPFYFQIFSHGIISGGISPGGYVMCSASVNATLRHFSLFGLVFRSAESLLILTGLKE